MTQPTDQSFGQLLQRARLEKKHLTPRDLARSANVGESVYKGWEVDQGRPNRLQLAKMFGTNHWLHPYLPKKTVVAEVAEPVMEREVRGPDSDVARTFGDALRMEREREGLGQDDLGAMLDPPVTGQAVSAWETNLNAPVLGNLAQLYELFPNLILAPKPQSQDIPVPNGGKSVPRMSTPPQPPQMVWTQPTLDEADPLRPEPPIGAPPIYTFHTPPEPMPTTSTVAPVPSASPVSPTPDSKLIEYVHALCIKLHGGEWSVRFFRKDNAWFASAEAHAGVGLEYTGVSRDVTGAPGAPHEALIDLLREARKEVDRRRKLLDELERDLPKEVF